LLRTFTLIPGWPPRRPDFHRQSAGRAKLIEGAQKSCCQLGYNRLPKVIHGVNSTDRIKTVEEDAYAAAVLPRPSSRAG
jgi:hypothetical protein